MRIVVMRLRVILGAGLVVVVWLLGLMSRGTWDHGAVSDAVTYGSSDRGEVVLASPPEAVPSAIDGTTLITVRRSGAHQWQVITTYRFTLAASDPLLAWLRANTDGFEKILVHLPGGYATEHADPFGSVSAPRACSIDQASPSAAAVITATSTRRLDDSASPAADYDFAQRLAVHGKPVEWQKARWTLSFDAPGWWFNITGQPETQQVGRASLPLTGSHPVERMALYQPGTVAPTQPDPWQGIRPLALSLGVVATLGASSFWLVRALVWRAFPETTRRWWLALSGGATAVLAVWTLLLDGRIVSWSNGASYYMSLYEYRQLSTAGMQQQCLALCWFALPVLFCGIGGRLVSGHPPSERMLFLVAAPGVGLLFLEAMVAGMADWVVQCLGLTVVACGIARAAMGWGAFGRTGRRWAATVAATALAATAGGTALTQLPSVPGNDGAPSNPWDVLAGPAAAFVVLPWVLAFLIVGMRLSATVAWTRAQFLVMVVFLVAIALPWNPDDVGESLGATMLTTVGGVLPPDESLQISVGMLTPAWQVIWVGAAALLVLVLRRAGRSAGRWPPAARLSCAALVWLAVTGPVLGDPWTYLAHWASAAVVVVALAAASWIMPTRDATRSLRLHGLTRAAHTRLIHSLLTSQLLSVGRQRFLLDSGTQLADGSLTPRAWDARWRSLGGAADPDPAGAARRLRSAALGSSAGFTPWANGAAAGIVSGVLGLPWTIALWWNGAIPTSLPQMLTTTCSPLAVWMAFGLAYGYLYPWIRGGDPLAKAASLTAATIPVQILLAQHGRGGAAAQQIESALLLTGQCVVVGLGLGLYWESRLVRAGGVPWGHIRNFRRLSSLALPATTIAVALLTALATVFATSWATAITSPTPRPPATVGSP